VAGLVTRGVQHLTLAPGVLVVVDRGRVIEGPGVDWEASAPQPPTAGGLASPSFADEAMVLSRWMERRTRAERPTAARPAA
jgi:hypothetical protein